MVEIDYVGFELELFSPFDTAVGHFRRYDKRWLAALAPPQLQQESSRYLDACGSLLSIGNRLLPHRGMPTRSQILTWDRYPVPLSRVPDSLCRYWLGKSILAIWRRKAQ